VFKLIFLFIKLHIIKTMIKLERTKEKKVFHNVSTINVKTYPVK